MAIALVASETYGFADGNAGHACVFAAGAPDVDDLDVLCVNSNTVVSTPSGFTSRVSAVANQGAYIFTRKAAGGESDSVTITTTNDHNTTVTWSRWSGTDAYSAGNSAQANNSNGTTLPAASTGTLAATSMLVIAFGALHNHDGALAASPLWTNSFTALQAVSQGSAGSSSSVVGLTGYKLNAGTASETIDSVSWTNAVRNRYALWIAVTAAASGSEPIEMGRASEVDTAATLGRSKSATLSRAGETDTAATLGRIKVAVLGRAIETDTAGMLTRSKAATLGRAVEVDTAGALGGGIDPTGAGSRIVASTPVGRITTSTPGGRL